MPAINNPMDASKRLSAMINIVESTVNDIPQAEIKCHRIIHPPHTAHGGGFVIHPSSSKKIN